MSMKKKNIYSFMILLCLFSLFSPSFYLFSADNKRFPAGKRPLAYEKQAGKITANPSKKPAQKLYEPTLTPIPEEPEVEQKKENENNNEKLLDGKNIDLTSSTKNIQTKPTTTGWLFNAYMVGMPFILVSLDKAVGTGIAASTKNVIKEFMARKAFGDLKANTLQSIDIALANEGMTASPEEKLDTMKYILKKQKIDYDQMEKSTSLSSILSQTAYIGMINTIVPLFATIFGLGVKIALQTLMPSEK